MSLIDIEYGSLASSEIMNKNFRYLEESITNTSDSIMTSISSILSNIATINTRLNDITEAMNDSVDTLTSTLEEYKTKTKLLANEASMLPNWLNCISVNIEVNENYVVPSNGYILLCPETSSTGEISVNGKTVIFKSVTDEFDKGSQLLVLPVAEADVVVSQLLLQRAYFLPTKAVSVEGF